MTIDWILFFSALLSATLLPGSSEALLAIKLNDASLNPVHLIIVASSGNILGSCITYWMGFLAKDWAAKWLTISFSRMQQAERWFDRWGMAVLWLTWLPLIGDAICLIAGSLRYRFALFLLWMGVGKTMRYLLLAFALKPEMIPW